MIIPHLSETEELQRILAIFTSGVRMCKSALFTLLYAIVTFLLVIVHVAAFFVNLAIGVLTLIHGAVCMARLLLTLCQDLAMMPRVPVIDTRRA